MGKYNKILTFSLAAAAIILPAAGLSSCSDEETVAGSDAGHTITLNITPVDNEDTRGAITSDHVSFENTIHRLAIAIVNPKTGNIIGGIREIEVSGQQTTGTTTYSFTDPEISEGDKVIVYANCPKGKFKGQTSYSGLKIDCTLDANEALYQDGGTIASYTNLPMYGEATASFNGTNNLTADVFIYHMVTKVTLNSLTVDLKSGDTFTPQEMLMSNVMGKASLTPITDYQFQTMSGVSVLNGDDISGGNLAHIYLTTGGNNSSGSTNSWTGTTNDDGSVVYTTNLPRFYVTPNDRTSDGPAGATKLVIKGNYKEGGKGDGKTVYYSMFINYNNNTNTSCDGRTPRAIYPNANYKLDVTIKGMGTENYDDVSNVGIVSLMSQYRGFSETTTPVVVGEYLFNDGSWGPFDRRQRNMVNSSHYPVAVIFSNTTSKIDQSHGWTHGYAVSLNKSGANMAWAASGTLYSNHKVAISNSNYTAPTTLKTVLADLDGYTETHQVMSATDYSSNPKTNYPAVYYAVNDGTSNVGQTNYYILINQYDEENPNPTNWWVESDDKRSTLGSNMAANTNTSGWYLGSVGQYYLMEKNLNGKAREYGTTFDDDDVKSFEGSDHIWFVDGVNVDGYYQNNRGLCTNNFLIESFYCSTCGDRFGNGKWTWYRNGNHTDLETQYGVRPIIYWTSSEYNDKSVYQIHIVPENCNTGDYDEEAGKIVITTVEKTKSTENTDCVGIRPVIAF